MQGVHLRVAWFTRIKFPTYVALAAAWQGSFRLAKRIPSRSPLHPTLEFS